VDSVYINRLKAGEFPEPEEEEEEVIEGRVERPRHPFINYECEEAESDTEEKETEEKETEESLLSRPSRLFPSPVKDRQESEKTIKFVKLNPPKDNKLNRSLPVKRNIELDESIQKIDEFIIKRKKARLEDSSDQTEDREEVSSNRREVKVSFSLTKCQSDSGNPPEPSRVVGRFKSGWVVQDEGDVWLMSPPRLRETILYERLMTSHVMPCEKMSEPLVVHPGILSQEEAHTALNMFTNNRQCPAKITDRRVTYNGFMLGLYETAGHNGDDVRSFTIRLEGKCPLLPRSGVSDLTELLRLVERCKDDSVRRTRPSNVREYLSKEATRLAGAMTDRELDRKTVEEMMVSRKEVLGTSVVSCLHGKPLMKLICTTDDSD